MDSAPSDESVHPLLESCKRWGFDGIEIPMFDFTVSNYGYEDGSSSWSWNRQR
ncbi:MAG: hypothetical protein U0992_08465 [Planctomycetaceae bacterium]